MPLTAETATEHIKERLKIIRTLITEIESKRQISENNLTEILQINAEVLKDEPTNYQKVCYTIFTLKASISLSL